MDNIFVQACFDLHCEWKETPPSYRVFVNNELFTERTYVWTDYYLTEMLQIEAPAGHYQITIVPMGPEADTLIVNNWDIEYGTARWLTKESESFKNTLEIHP